MDVSDTNSIIERIEGVRKVILKFLILSLGLSILTYPFCEEILVILLKNPITLWSYGKPLAFYKIPEAFFVRIKICLFAGIFLSTPYLFSQLWKLFGFLFIHDSKRYTIFVTFLASFLFLLGASLAYFVLLPAGINFLVSYSTNYLKPMISASRYYSFCIAIILALGFFLRCHWWPSCWGGQG